MASITPNSPTKWPNNTRAAVSVTIDNMGEAADINRNLWPKSEPVGKHYAVTKVLPQILSLLKKYDISATYFIESWNINVYGDVILDQVAKAGHEIGWHAWQHEAWAKLSDKEERENFERSFGPQGIGQWLSTGKSEPYHGFRPPGGIINGERTLQLCRDFGLGYLSPAAEVAAIVEFGAHQDKMVILPFKWCTVDAYFYMETFGGLRRMKGDYPADPQPPSVLIQRYKAEIDNAIETGGFVSILFHPFLTDSEERLDALESVLKYLELKRDEGQIWIARCKDVEEYVRLHPEVVGKDPRWDSSSWR